MTKFTPISLILEFVIIFFISNLFLKVFFNLFQKIPMRGLEKEGEVSTISELFPSLGAFDFERFLYKQTPHQQI